MINFSHLHISLNLFIKLIAEICPLNAYLFFILVAIIAFKSEAIIWAVVLEP